MTDASVPDAVCPACGEPVLPGDRFCESCGAEVGPAAEARAVCAHCGERAEIVEGYCSLCGMKQPSPRDHLEQSWPGVGAVTDKGRTHHRNEDAMAVIVGTGFVVAVVCDGTSTSADSDKASQAAADAAAAVLAGGGPEDADFAGAYEAARKSVLAMPYEPNPALDPPTCTYLAAVVTDDDVVLATLGDCRSYWVADGEARLLTADDSWSTEQIARGAMSVEEAMAHPQGHAITRWISADADPQWRPTLTRFEVPGSGRLILCSDGLWNYMLQPETVAAEVANLAGAAGAAEADGTERADGAEADPLALARHLTTFANESGGHDNITVVVVDLPLKGGATEA
ncbi:MAG: PP2C family serine/threonine-protein phosphatase [Acidimicrobiales bacterium]